MVGAAATWDPSTMQVGEPILRFGEFELDEARFELRRGGARVALQPKALDLLFYLAHHRSRVVPRRELMAEIWKGVAVTEDSLDKAVSAARHALGDRGRAQRLIETVRARGFRFVAPVEEPDAVPADSAVLVGREDVLACIAESVSAAHTGTGSLVLLSGEAGIGKTRVAREASGRARQAGARVLAGWCHEDGGSPSLWPWLRALRPVLEADDPLVLARELGEGIFDLAARLPGLRERLPARQTGAQQDPRQVQFRIFETVVELLRRASAQAPALLVLDDVHRADGDSLSLLAFLARELADTRLAVLVTYRADDLSPGHALLEVARRPECRPLSLAGLPLRDVALLIESQLGRPVEEPFVRAIHERTAGNPFFVKELVRELVARGGLDAPAAGELALPSAVREVLAQRLDRLPSECREILTLGALLGQEFELAVVARVAGLAPDHALELLDTARAAHVLERAGTASRFAHALVAEALVEGLSAEERAERHRRIGEALEAHHAADLEDHLAELTRHFAAAAASGGAEKAIEYARRAGDAAAAVLACDEAAAHYRTALGMVEMLEAAEERLRCEVLLGLGEAEMGAGRSDEGRDSLRRAAALARRLGLAEHLARAALASGGLALSTEVGVEDPDLVAALEEALAALPAEPSSLRVRLLVRLALALTWSGDFARFGALGAEALDAAEQLGDPIALGHALYVHRWSLLGPGDLPGRLAASDRMLGLARTARQREIELAARSCRFLDLLEAGRLPRADRELAAYERLAAAFGVPRYRWRANFYRITRVMLEGRFAEAEELAARGHGDEQRFAPGDAGLVYGVQLATLRYEQDRLGELEPALRYLADRFPAMPIWIGVHGLALVESGRDAEARADFDALAAGNFPTVPKYFGRLVTLVVLAELCAMLRDAAQAAYLYDVLRPFAPRTAVVGAGTACWGSVDLWAGRLAALLGDLESAARHFEAAREMNARIGARPWLAWSEYELARLLAARDGAQAARHLDRAAEIAAALGMARLARRADALAAELA
jgi:DNA-binding winged helix-turn-helix (wHTH) protein/tetratricopeptide (TPR) repeat protein